MCGSEAAGGRGVVAIGNSYCGISCMSICTSSLLTTFLYHFISVVSLIMEVRALQ